MGAGSSFQDEVDGFESTLSIVSTNSSGYQSISDNQDTLPPVEKDKNLKNNKIMPPKKPLTSRLSVGAVMRRELQRMDELKNNSVKKTPELRKVFDGFSECEKFLLDKTKRANQYYGSLNKLLNDKVLEPFYKFDTDEQRMVLANELARLNFVEPLVEYYNFVYEDLKVDGINNAFVEEAQIDDVDPGFPLILTMREILWNYADGSHSFSEKIAGTVIFKMLANDLEVIGSCGLEDVEGYNESELFAFCSAVGILHNCARNPDIDRSMFRENRIPETLYPFLQSTQNYVKISTLLALGNMMTDEEVSQMEADNSIVDLLTKSIIAALADKDRKQHGFHLTELVDGLAAMAQSEANKSVIMSKTELLPTLVKIIEGKVYSETLASVKLVWELAFLEENREKIKKHQMLMTAVQELKSHNDKDVKNAARGAWFELVGKSERQHHEDKCSEHGNHIMISYQWGDKETVLKIYNILAKEGYKIWIDEQEMNRYGDLLEGMARAIEEAFLVFICYSERYKNSYNCRTEAEYVYALGKKFIPLKMQRGYKPQGWLGALIGARLYIEFSPHYPFEKQMEHLRSRIKDDKQESGSLKELEPVVRKEPPPELKLVRNWTKVEVDAWIQEHKLEGSTYKHVKKLTGEQLEFLYKVMIKSPGTFYGWLETKLDLKSLEDLMKFDRALTALEKHVRL